MAKEGDVKAGTAIAGEEAERDPTKVGRKTLIKEAKTIVRVPAARAEQRNNAGAREFQLILVKRSSQEVLKPPKKI